MRIIRHDTWSEYDNVDLDDIELPAEYVVIHHTADAGPSAGKQATQAEDIAYLRGVERYHVETREYDVIAYSFIITPAGRVYEGRGWGKRGAHTRDHNTDAHAICFAGTFTSSKPTGKAIDACRELIHRGIRAGKIRVDRDGNPTIRPHRAMSGNSTSCPGDKLVVALSEIREPWTD